MDLNDACLSLTNTLPGCFDRLTAVYDRMDAAYAAVAGHAGFVCTGCEDNCCRTRFRHHSLIEYAYLRKGFEGLAAALRDKVRDLAGHYQEALQAAEFQHALFRQWCPLNHEGRCILYAFRPMICRLHGLPHILRHPARGLIEGPGCHIFEAQCRNVPSRPLDRTELYRSLAGLEQDARQKTGFRSPVGMTVADMILAFPDSRKTDDVTGRPAVSFPCSAVVTESNENI